MFPHFWVGNLVNSTSLLCHPIHILPCKLVCACNVKNKCYFKPKPILQQEKKNTYTHGTIEKLKKKKNWKTINKQKKQKNVKKGNAKALKLPRHQH
jgi:hypothetical protein